MLFRLLFLSFLSYAFQSTRMDGPENRPHVVTGNTPNRPREKRAHDDDASETCDQRPARRTLAFQERKSFATGTMMYLDLLPI